MSIYVAFLRGINVGGHHKVPMADLKQLLTKMGFEQVRTILNSGNIVFAAKQNNLQQLEAKIESELEKYFGFSIPVILLPQQQIIELVKQNPFAAIEVHPHIRLYVSFSKKLPSVQIALPYLSADNAFSILSIQNDTIISVLDLTTSNTPKGMDDLEKLFGKNMTTRNWNTIQKLAI